jgi:radical SAM-linked protein
MITAKFSKIDYSRFLSHLDLQTIINRAIKRAGFIINYSQGFNPHPILKMSPPIPLGIKSSAEYFTTDIFVQDKGIFEEKIRDTLPKGI